MDDTTLSARDRILVTAHDLFYADGIRATGVDRIIAESGVAKLTFYRHFPSKDELVMAYLNYRHEHWMAWFVDALGRHGATAGGGLQPLVKTMQEWFENPVFRGCAFINVVAEMGGSQPGMVALAQAHKDAMLRVIEGLLPDRDAAIASAAALAVDGAIVRAQTDAGSAMLTGQKKSALDGLRQVLMALERA
ncbi:MAG: TetR/AcrR family transcriptional regulator [Polaromonas sp.]|uniref:TetR/AcrR family transcriptional regulator n=1 Tax=Polaromonas sp. TaxID=1869339 RepID=UPI0025EC31D9|nr:TetR/AcrR family transcriptional regulator [Polaromonas sp.]MBI2727122.1 TetR/AcrR family transcriptional regulator [Polaromonas sp.]